MFGRKDNRKLMELQRELLAVEEEEEYEEYEEESFDEFLDDPEEDIPEEAEEDFTQEYTDDGQGQYPNFANHYGRGSPKRFEDIDFFDEGDFDDGFLCLRVKLIQLIHQPLNMGNDGTDGRHENVGKGNRQFFKL